MSIRSFKYIIKNVNKKNSHGAFHEYTQDSLCNKVCIVADCNVGDCAWLFVNFPDDNECEWHRVHTSEVLNLTDSNNIITIETENTIYELEELINDN